MEKGGEVQMGEGPGRWREGGSRLRDIGEGWGGRCIDGNGRRGVLEGGGLR